MNRKLKNKAIKTSELTKKQSLVMNLLSGTKGPLTAYNMLYDRRDHGFRGPTQIYRVLEKLLKIGMIHRIGSMNPFVACQQEKCDKKIKRSICSLFMKFVEMSKNF